MHKKYSDKIENNKRRLIINKKKSNFNDDNNNYFLNGEDLELPNFQKNNYQNQFMNRKLFASNPKKIKSKYIFNYSHYNYKDDKIKENNYYSNNSNITQKIDNYFNNDSLAENFEHLKQMNSNINNILSNMQKEIQTTNKKKEEEIQNKIQNNNFDKFNENFYNNDNSILNNIQNNKFIIDRNIQNQINIQGIKENKDPLNINLNDFKPEQEKKLNSVYKNNKIKIINVDKLINDLYENKIKYEKMKIIFASKNIEKNKKEINDDLSKIKVENKKLNSQKHFLINELTKSIYNYENLRNKYTDELNRINSYLNKIKYDLKEKTPNN